MNKLSLLNLVIRALTIGSKFLLIIYMAKILSTSDLGVYGLFTASVNYALYLVGLDYYTYTTRELLSRPQDQWAPILRDQFCFYLLTYFFSFPVLLLIFSTGLLSWNLAIWLYSIVALEHFSQEIYRIMVTLQKPMFANILSFVRLGAWAYAVLAIFYFTPIPKILVVVWWGWAGGALSSIIIGLVVLRKTINWLPLQKVGIDWKAMYRGSKTSVRFLVATLSLRAIFTLDRYFLKELTTTAEVGIYSFYMSIAMSIQSFLEAGVVIFSYPKVVETYQTGDMIEYNKARHRMQQSIIGWIIVLSSGVVLIIQPLVRYIGKELFLEQLPTFYWLVLSVGLLGLSNLPHYELYAKRKDKAIILSACWALLSFLGSAWIFGSVYGMVGIAISIAVSMGLLLFSKFFYTLDLNFSRLNHKSL